MARRGGARRRSTRGRGRRIVDELKCLAGFVPGIAGIVAVIIVILAALGSEAKGSAFGKVGMRAAAAAASPTQVVAPKALSADGIRGYRNLACPRRCRIKPAIMSKPR